MKLTVKTSQKEYPIYIKRGAIASLNTYIDTNKTIFLLSDDGVPTELLDTILNQCSSIYCMRVAAGEQAKSFDGYQAVIKQLLHHNIQRGDMIVAVGGGVIGDLAGFVAATYLRGIDFVNIPTTTLAQIDSSIGGKVAINVDNIKNIVGSFYPPSCVIIDLNTLATLPKRHYNNGLVEAIKAGLIADPTLFALFETKHIETAIDDIIYRALLVKKNIVEQDEFEYGIRKTLNFGHTIGHAIESYYGLSEILHGEAVAYGMMKMINNPSLKQRLSFIYQTLSLPLSIPYEVDALYETILHDKKTHQNAITVVLVEELGNAILKDIPMEAIKQYLEETI